MPRTIPGTTSGISVVAVRPNAWKIGSVDISTSLSSVFSTSEICLMFAMMLRWDSITPFGTPSLPLENRIAAGLSIGTRFMYSSFSSHAGNTTACSKVVTRRTCEICG